MDSRYRITTRPVAEPASVIRGDRFRITVLTAGLLRLEYADDGIFEDRASAFALYRDLPVPDFRVIDTDLSLEILTERIHLVYDRAAFSTSGLSIQIRGNISTYHSVWRFGEIPDDLGGTARTLDKADGGVPLEPGVNSRWGFSVIDDSSSLLLDSDGWVAPRDGSKIDLYFFGYGHEYSAAVRALYALSGPTPVLPRFALGNWWSRYHRYSAGEYLDLLDRFREAGVPFSVAVLDIHWHPVDIDPQYGSGWTGYSWNRELFPDPAEFLRRLHQQGLRITLNVHPADGIRAFEDQYPAMAAALGIDPESGDPVAFDVTNPEFLTAYFEILHRSLEDEGIDFWWIDWQSGPHSRVAGIDPLWMLNHFHFRDSARDSRRPLTFSRYAGPGSHRYPVGFSGDSVISWASLHFQPYFTATAANIGYGWWSHDIGGHMFGGKDDELATRWLQLGVFSPINRLHSGLSPFNSKEPWRFGPAAQAVMTEFLRLRHRLLPYLHTMNHRAAREGSPLVQPMYWQHPEEPDAYDVPNQFIFGTQLLVAPITTPVDSSLQLASVRAWLPTGAWFDVLGGLVYSGDRQIVLHRDLTQIPVLARAGAIIPLTAEQVPGNATDNPAALEVLVVVGADGRFDLIEDDGSGAGSEPAAVARTGITYVQETGTVTILPVDGALHCLPATRDWQVTFLGSATVTRIVAAVNGNAIEPDVDEMVGRLSVSVADVPATSSLVITLGPNPALAENDVTGRIFTLLDRAQIEFELKKKIYDSVCSGRPLAVQLSALQAMALPRSLETAAGEILTANGGPGN
ncbi:MAG: TIM-barrel domain-containing protein [Nakamurella sp.]